LGELTQKVDPDIELEIEDGNIQFNRKGETKHQKSMHGLYRSLVNNMVTGVSKGYEIKLELVGVGFRAELLPDNVLDLVLGFSHHIYIQIPSEVQVEAKSEKRASPIITLKSYDKQLIGQVAAKIRSFRKPEPYKGKGIKFVGEELRRKAGKAAAAK
jgi:large subunit ribosomal protein L6